MKDQILEFLQECISFGVKRFNIKNLMMERGRFELSVILLLHMLFKRAPSTTRPPLQLIFPLIYNNKLIVNRNSL